jgi:hypothetical protein
MANGKYRLPCYPVLSTARMNTLIIIIIIIIITIII